eukprot:scaffold212213_cov18-Tisochrysis_lutea.AAC.2
MLQAAAPIWHRVAYEACIEIKMGLIGGLWKSGIDLLRGVVNSMSCFRNSQAGACGAECSLFDIFVDTVAQLVGRSAKDIRADLLAQHDRGLSPSPECCDKGIMADNHADCIPFCSPSSSFMTTRGRCGYKYA